MSGQEEYSDFLQLRYEVFPDFDAHQAKAIDSIFGLLRPFIKSGEIKTIVDVGCGTGEILVGLAEKFEQDPKLGAIDLIGLDSSEAELRIAGELCAPASVRFSKCEGSNVFFDDLTAELGFSPDPGIFSKQIESTAILCTGHTIFHFPYLIDLFERIETGQQRPRLWVVDVYRTWDEAITKPEYLEPRSVYERGGKKSVNILFTRPSGVRPGMVERGMLRWTGGWDGERELISTVQHAWKMDELIERFASAGYINRRLKDTVCGYGEMKTHLFVLPQQSLPLPELFLRTGLPIAELKPRLGSADNYSPLPAVNKWVEDAPLICDTRHESFDFVLVEFAPYFDAWHGRHNLFQEVFLAVRLDYSAAPFEAIVPNYVRMTGALQDQGRGIFFHPFFTGQQHSAEWAAVNLSHIDKFGRSMTVMTEGELDELKDWRRQASEAEKNLVKNVRTIEGSNVNARWAEYRTPLSEFELKKGDGGDRSPRRDFQLKLELLHQLAREKFGITTNGGEEQYRTVLLASPLRLTFSGRDDGDNGYPSSYRGGVWIFAGTRERFGRRRYRKLRDLTRLCLLTGISAVEASASISLSTGIKRQSVQTAAVAIMSRNMSHNIGSHVLSGVAAEAIGGSAADRAAAKLSESKYVKRQLKQQDDLLRYLQERMDFLAEISTTESYMSVPISINEATNDFHSQELLRKFITGTGAASSLINKGRERVLMASPGGRNGCQALYVIAENVIRNAAKHRPANVTNAIQLSMCVDDVNQKDFLRVRLWDNQKSARRIRDGLSVVDFVNRIVGREPQHAESRRRSQLVSIVDEKGKLKEGNWGLREIAIAAAYLRQMPLQDLESITEPPLLRAMAVDDDGRELGEGDGNLCYEFYVRRPQSVLGIDRNGPPPDLDLNVLHVAGVELVVPAEPDADSTAEHRYAASTAGHQYLVGDDKSIDDLSEKTELRLPARVLRLGLETKLANPKSARIDSAEFYSVLRSGNGDKIWRQVARRWTEFQSIRHGVIGARLFHTDVSTDDPCGTKYSDEAVLSHAILYDHHGEVLRHGLNKVREVLFWESYGQAFDQCSLFESPLKPTKDALEAEFIAAAMARIVVLDERVQEEIANHKGAIPGIVHEGVSTPISMIEAVERRRIYVPGASEFCDLRRSPNRVAMEHFIQHVLSKGPIDFVVIHQGVLDRVPTSSQEDHSAIEWIKSRLPADTKLVICSGRGVPSEVFKEDVRFVSVSPILRWVVHVPSKFHLYQFLCASRVPVQHV